MLPSWPVFPLIILVALFWTLFKLSMSFMYWGTPKWDFLLHRWPHTCKAEGNGCFPRPAGWLLLTQVDRWLFLSTAGIPCWLMFSLPYIRTHTSLSAELLPRLSVPIWFISCARAMTWHLSSWHSCVWTFSPIPKLLASGTPQDVLLHHMFPVTDGDVKKR